MIRVGLLSDTHINSINFDESALEKTITELNSQSDIILHAGDLTDGRWVYAGQDQELITLDMNQVLELTRSFLDAIRRPFYFITGNHDHKVLDRTGLDIGTEVEVSDHVTYLGDYMADVPELISGKKFRLLHPSGGGAYSISYPAQKYLRQLDIRKDNIDWLVMGHYHTGYQFSMQGVQVVGLPSYMKANSFTKRRGFGEEIGYDLLKLHNDGSFTHKRRRF